MDKRLETCLEGDSTKFTPSSEYTFKQEHLVQRKFDQQQLWHWF